MNKLIFSLIFFAFSSSFADPSKCLEIFEARDMVDVQAVAKLQSTAMDYFVKHLRLPSVSYLANSNGLTERRVNELIPDYGSFWDQAIASNEKKVSDAKRILTIAYNAFMVEQKKSGITPRSATAEEVYQKLIELNKNLSTDASEGNFEVKHVLRLLGLRDRQPGKIPYPVLFDGTEGLRLGTKKDFPNSFKGLRDSRYAKEYHEKIARELVNTYSGGIAISFRGVPWEKGKPFFNSIAALAKDRNLLILIKEINGDPDQIPLEILNHPQVRLISQTIDLGPELRLWGSMMIIPTNKDPLAGLKSRMVNVPRGQKQIVFSTQRSLGVVATDKNAITGSHQVWSTGTLNDPVYPYSNLRSSRVSEMAKQRDIMAAVIFEKSDRNAGPLGRGAPGRWHISHFDYQPKLEAPTQVAVWDSGGVFNLKFYPTDGSAPRFMHPLVLVPGDVHLGFESQTLLASMDRQFFVPALENGGRVIYLRLHDFLSHEEISKWLTPAQRASLYKNGELSLKAAHNFARSMVNDIRARYPNIRIVLSTEDNHHAWLYKALDDHSMLDDPINGPYLKDLASLRAQGHDVLEYIFKDQESYDRAIPNMAKRYARMSENVYVEDPSSIIILKRGDPYDVGPAGATWNIAQHGHMAARGAKGGSNMEPHAVGNDRSASGHSHEEAIVGNAFNPGMIVRLRSQAYALGSYSAQDNGLLVIYENGAPQLGTFDPQIGAFFPETVVGTLRGSKFFTRTPVVLENDNDLVGPGYTSFNNYESPKGPSTPLLPN